MGSRIGLGDLQSAIMRILWQRGEASVNDVHSTLLDERGLAPTTIATMLKKMEAKGVVRWCRSWWGGCSRGTRRPWSAT